MERHFMLKIESNEHDHGNLVLPDLTALLDVLFIVLVFLLLSIATPVDMLDITLPNAGEHANKQQASSKHLVISLAYQHNRVSYGLAKTKYYSLDLLLNSLKKSKKKEVTLMLAIDKKAPSENLIELLAALSGQGYQVANILIDSPSNKIK